MNNSSFYASSHAKCILAGEHSVLRGYSALVSPVKEKIISLRYQHNFTFDIEVSSSHESICRQTFINILRHSLHLLKKNPEQLKGKFFIFNNILMGAGLGYSAALSVVVTHWLIWNKWLAENQLHSFSRKLEDFFHGKSSGVDIAGVLSDDMLHFNTPDYRHPIRVNWKPLLLLSYSGNTKATKNHIQKVHHLIKSKPEFFKRVDDKMQQSVLAIEEALLLDNCAINKLATAINNACECFRDWTLITPPLQNYIESIYQMGALAAKPTGSGGGGYVLSLWDKPPPSTTINFIPLHWI